MNQKTWHLVAGGLAKGAKEPADIPPPLLSRQDDPRMYEADPALIDAANVAIELGQPLLLSGEPGSGKTAFAAHVAWQLGLPYERFQARTTTEAKDLFYSYDNIGRFRDAHEKTGDFAPESFLTLNALGKAIVLAAKPGDLRRRLLGKEAPQSRAVVLIDEIDKAPRDVPNDLLGFLTGERLWFRIPELDSRVEPIVSIEAEASKQPILICTSNSEKALPEPFLRRCIFHNIAFPEGTRLRSIVERRVTGLPADAPLTKDAEKLIAHIRSMGPQKNPGLAEALGFLLALRARGYGPERQLEAGGPWQDIARVTLLKHPEDQRRARDLLDFGRQ